MPGGVWWNSDSGKGDKSVYLTTLQECSVGGWAV